MDKVKATVRRIKGRIKRIARWCGEREPGMVIRVKNDGEVGLYYLAPLLEAKIEPTGDAKQDMLQTDEAAMIYYAAQELRKAGYKVGPVFGDPAEGLASERVLAEETERREHIEELAELLEDDIPEAD